MLRARGVGLGLLVGPTLAAPSACAHAGSLALAADGLTHGVWTAFTWMIVAILALAAMPTARGRRVLLAGLLVVLVFESGVHSAHHAHEARPLKCALAAAILYCVATEVEPAEVRPETIEAWSPLLSPVPRAVVRPRAAHRDRAPPPAGEPHGTGSRA